ncbi:urea carboxylase [Aquisalimonas sp. 2447]|uniref:urea carboxylase n=1 Tax=Aquisalimonas sp. 2447 TaxID=2740807 RepID=UPI0014324A76|nr:urea carboxylase [Aquisalimonas sp. 2447]QIT54239.1 urea carboxylase [Aquisalimonas sp. 2447]
MFSKVLIANRGAIACRIIRTLKRLGVHSVAVYSEADRHSLHVHQADEAVHIGDSAASASYLDADRILRVARETGAEAIHPGYGFLSENAEFAEACEAAGIAFIGPTGQQMRDFGLKHTARSLAEANDVPMLPGTGLLESLNEAVGEAERIGYPVMLKSTAGGGGIGMQLCHSEAELRDAYDSVKRLSQNNFSNSGIFLEKFVRRARHIEVQLFGDGQGGVIALGERDCSLQRRNQKVVEETPAPNITDAVRADLLTAAEKLGRGVNYRSAGTVEYIFDADTGEFYFLEVNTRLQVEHGVTEEVTGVDLVEWMVRGAAGDLPDLERLRPGPPEGHSIQVRLYAEDPGKNFQPSTGLLTEAVFPEGVRVDTWVERGSEISPYYDPMIAKVIVHAADRAAAIEKMQTALAATELHGLETNLLYLRQVIADHTFGKGEATTQYLNSFTYHAPTIDVVSPGTQTTVQDWPGRVGYWDIGVPPSGPMDMLAFRMGNRIVGNDEGAAGLELTVTGPSLRFNTDAVIALTGAAMRAKLDGEPLTFWRPVMVTAGQTLKLGPVQGAGTRAYLLVAGGIDVPLHMGSRATFTLGQMGGHGARALQPGDVLHIGDTDTVDAVTPKEGAVPEYGNHWNIRTVYGPHGAPDFFTQRDVDTFFGTDWEIHYNSSRTGVRLVGPKPEWAREDGGEAGLHPSNIHDNAYAIGTIDFTGDMPVILGPDGPSLGGFVCPATIISADLWKMGQLNPGDSVRFLPVSVAEANRLEAAQDAAIAALQSAESEAEAVPVTTPILKNERGNGHPLGVTYRPAGDKYLLVEYGPIELDLNLRFRVQALLEWLTEQRITGITEMTPGVRSLQIHYEPKQLPLAQLMQLLEQAEAELKDLSEAELPSRIIHLPLAWDDSQTQLATRKYMQSVRSDAPWCPRNIEFIRRINGLDSEEDVKRIVFDASYLVMGLGDVYLSAPLATPVDPRHRLVTTKYNPARTWTPENAVGIGGSYMCIYGMEGPGGYQFVGRTLQIWNRYKVTPEFQQPWLLRFFDQIRFYEVTEEELLAMRDAFPKGGLRIDIEETTFSLKRYNAFLAANRDSIDTFKTQQQAAFEAERQRWIETGQANYEADAEPPAPEPDAVELADGEYAVEGHVHGSLWALDVKEGDRVEEDQQLLVLESMKMEIPVLAESAGTVKRVLGSEGSQVTPGQVLLVIAEDVQ